MVILILKGCLISIENYERYLDIVDFFISNISLIIIPIVFNFYKQIALEKKSLEHLGRKIYIFLVPLAFVLLFIYLFINGVITFSYLILILFFLLLNLEVVFKLYPSFTMIEINNERYLLLQNKGEFLYVQTLEQVDNSFQKTKHKVFKKNLYHSDYQIIRADNNLIIRNFYMKEMDLSFFRSHKDYFWSLIWFLIFELLMILLIILSFTAFKNHIDMLQSILFFLFNFYILLCLRELKLSLYHYKFILQCKEFNL